MKQSDNFAIDALAGLLPIPPRGSGGFPFRRFFTAMGADAERHRAAR